MNEFVEECRREWRRLRVPDPVANEMAADLAADLVEAEADGVSAEEVLGSGAFDPRSFAASWAAERGVIQPSPVGAEKLPRRSRLPVAIAAFALIAVIGALLAMLASPPGPERVAFAAPGIGGVAPPGPPRFREVVPREHRVLPPVPDRFGIVPVPVNASSAAHTIGLLLLLGGLVGIIVSTLFWIWARQDGWSRRGTHIDEPPPGPAY